MPTTTTWTPIEILAYTQNPAAIPVTIASGQNLAKGTVLGRITASGLYSAYNNGNSDGTEVADGILKDVVNASSTGTNQDTESAMYVEGAFLEDQLTGLDSNAKTDLNGRTVTARNIFKF